MLRFGKDFFGLKKDMCFAWDHMGVYGNHIKVSKIISKYTRLRNRVALNGISFLVKKVAKKGITEIKV